MECERSLGDAFPECHGCSGHGPLGKALRHAKEVDNVSRALEERYTSTELHEVGLGLVEIDFHRLVFCKGLQDESESEHTNAAPTGYQTELLKNRS